MKDSTPADEGFFLKTTPITGALRFSDYSPSYIAFMGHAEGKHVPLLTLHADGRVVVSDNLTAEGTAAEVLRLITERWGSSLASSMGVDGAVRAMDALSPEDFALAMEKLRERFCFDCGKRKVLSCHCENDK